MQRQNLPALDDRYWVAILIASILGTALGDFISTGLNFGFGGGLGPLLVLFVMVLLAEHRAKVPSEAYYWTAIVITRATATNLADLVTRSLEFGYTVVSAVLVVLGIIFFLWSRHAVASSAQASLASNLIASDTNTNRPAKPLPSVDARYWATIFVVSTMGTAFGDLVSNDLRLGFAVASLLLGALLAIVVAVERRAKAPNEARYWIAILITRTTGTAMGDFLTTPEGLNLGYGWGAVALAVLLIAVLRVWRPAYVYAKH